MKIQKATERHRLFLALLAALVALGGVITGCSKQETEDTSTPPEGAATAGTAETSPGAPPAEAQPKTAKGRTGQ